MTTMLKLYREFGSRPKRELTVEDLEARNYSRNNAHAILSRFRESGLAESIGPGRIRLLLPDEAQQRTEERERDPLVEELQREGAKATGFSVLPQRYPGPRPLEFIVPPGVIVDFKEHLERHHPDRHVVVNRYEADEDAVCLYPGRVRGEEASLEEALLHVYRHAPGDDFGLALQSLLHHKSELNWPWLRRQDEWLELAGIFAAVDSMTEENVFPNFRKTEPPRISYNAIETAAQPLVARGT